MQWQISPLSPLPSLHPELATTHYGADSNLAMRWGDYHIQENSGAQKRAAPSAATQHQPLSRTKTQAHGRQVWFNLTRLNHWKVPFFYILVHRDLHGAGPQPGTHTPPVKDDL